MIAVNSNSQSTGSNNTTESHNAMDIVASPSKSSNNNIPSLQVIESFTAHSSNCFNLAIDISYNRMAVGSFDFTVTLWDLQDMICKTTIAFE